MAMIPSTSHATLTGDSDALIAMQIIWEAKKERNMKRFHSHAKKLLAALQKPPVLDVTWHGPADEESFSSQEEDANSLLEQVRVIKGIVGGTGMKVLLRRVRLQWPPLAHQLREAADHCMHVMSEAEQSILFLLDREVDDEWLPEMAPAEAFGPDEEAVEVVL